MSKVEKVRFQRVVDWLELTKTFPTGLKGRLRRAVSPNHDEHLMALIQDYLKCVEELNHTIDMHVDLVRARAFEHGMKLTTTYSVCKQNCAVCLRVKGLHYPYWRIGDKWVSGKRFFELCMRIGITPEQFHELDRASWARHRLIAWMHGLPIMEAHMGITGIKVKTPDVKAPKKVTS